MIDLWSILRTGIEIAIIRTRMRFIATVSLRVEMRLGSSTRLCLRSGLKLGKSLERMSILSLLILMLLILAWEL